MAVLHTVYFQRAKKIQLHSLLLLWCRVALEFELNNIFCTKLAQNVTLNCVFVVFLIYEELELLGGRGFNLDYSMCVVCYVVSTKI